METNNLSDNQKNLGALMHISTFAKYFFPFANFFVPLILWTSNKEKPFAREHGRQAINFQLSLFLYTLILAALCLPFFVIYATDFIMLVENVDHQIHATDFQNMKNLTGFITFFGIIALVFFGLFVLELYAVITGTMNAANGRLYKYPLCINFIGKDIIPEPTIKTTSHEHSS